MAPCVSKKVTPCEPCRSTTMSPIPCAVRHCLKTSLPPSTTLPARPGPVEPMTVTVISPQLQKSSFHSGGRSSDQSWSLYSSCQSVTPLLYVEDTAAWFFQIKKKPKRFLSCACRRRSNGHTRLTGSHSQGGRHLPLRRTTRLCQASCTECLWHTGHVVRQSPNVALSSSISPKEDALNTCCLAQWQPSTNALLRRCVTRLEAVRSVKTRLGHLIP